MEEDEGQWPERITRAVMKQVRRYREARGWSLDDLATYCSKTLGYPIVKSTLGNLETGRRKTMSVHELFVLAAALQVPPGLLLAPLELADAVEFLPGVEAPPEVVLGWLEGREQLPRNKAVSGRWHRTDAAITIGPGGPTDTYAGDDEAWKRNTDIVRDFTAHQAALDDVHDRYAKLRGSRAFKAGSAEPDPEVDEIIERNQQALSDAVEKLRGLRAKLRNRGVRPPAITTPWLAATLSEGEGQDDREGR